MQIKLSLLLTILLLLLTTIDMVNAQGADISELQQRCKNITAQQKQLAAAAGVDIADLCSNVSSTNISKTPNTDERTERSEIEDENNPIFPARNAFQNENEFFSNEPTGFQPVMEDGLEKYGYSLFSSSPTTFAPVTAIPVPVDYVLGVGDNIQIQLLGKLNETYDLPVNRDGSINFPSLGPISVTGLKFSQAQQLLQQKVAEEMIGVTAHVTIGELRSIRVFVLGEAFKPGSYTVSSLSTMTNAIFVSGGVTNIASLRNIQLKRRGKRITTLDLYALLQKGDTSKDKHLQSGDVIYIPPVSKSVRVIGEVNRPAVYELVKGDDLGDLVKVAGGYSSNAYPKSSYITRNNKAGFRSVVDVDLTRKKVLNYAIKSGDELNVGSVLKQYEDVVTLTGHFHRPRDVKWTAGMRISDVITAISEFKDNPELSIALIIRKEMPLRKISVLHFSVESMLNSRTESNNPYLKPLDEIIVLASGAFSEVDNDNSDADSDDDLDGASDSAFDLDFNKDKFGSKTAQSSNNEVFELAAELLPSNQTIDYIRPDALQNPKFNRQRNEIFDPIIGLIKQQASDGRLAELVTISGNVKYPGTYPKSKEMSVKDLVLLAGGLEEGSYLGNIEITRRDLSDTERATIEHINVNLAMQLQDKEKFILEAKDKISVYVTPEYAENMVIEIEGQVRFPGSYEFKQGETLSQVIKRAGGFSSVADVRAAVFTREELRLQEEKQLENLKNRLKSDIVASELEEKAAGKSASVGQAEQLLSALGESEALGRLVVRLDKIIAGKSDDIRLKPGDKLIVPSVRQEVSVLGEVQHSSSHMYNEQWVLEDYLESSGGLTKRADDDRIYVVRADGSVFLPSQSGWLTHQNEMLMAGDTIVVPLDTDKVKTLALFTQVSQVIYQLALGVAAVSSL